MAAAAIRPVRSQLAAGGHRRGGVRGRWGLAVSVWHNLGYGALLAAFGVPLLGGLFAYSAERRSVLSSR